MKRFKVILHVNRENKDKVVFECDDNKSANGFIANVTRYLEPFEYGFHDDMKIWYILNGKKMIYESKSYEIPR